MIRHIEPLIRAVGAARMEALMNTEEQLARLAALADQITRGKDILFENAEFDRPVAEIPPERMRYFTKSYQKWNDWLAEYEKLLAQLHRKTALPDVRRCQGCGLPVHTPWRSNEACEMCEGDNAPVFKQMQNNGGWVIINSRVLGESIVIIRDASVPVTTEQRGLVRYAVAEVVLLQHAKEENLKQLHEIKKIIGGTIE